MWKLCNYAQFIMKLFANYEQQIIYCIYIYTVKNDQTTVQVNLFILILYQFIFGITAIIAFVLHFKEKLVKCKQDESQTLSLNIYSSLTKELELIGWDK